jgi:hypothetical protein
VHTGFSFVDQVECQKSMCIRADEPCTFTKFYGWGSDKFMKRDALERSTHLKDDHPVRRHVLQGPQHLGYRLHHL